jgi:hypothetical protein
MEQGKYWEVPDRFDWTLHGEFLCLCLCADDCHIQGQLLPVVKIDPREEAFCEKFMTPLLLRTIVIGLYPFTPILEEIAAIQARFI